MCIGANNITYHTFAYTTFHDSSEMLWGLINKQPTLGQMIHKHVVYINSQQKQHWAAPLYERSNKTYTTRMNNNNMSTCILISDLFAARGALLENRKWSLVKFLCFCSCGADHRETRWISVCLCWSSFQLFHCLTFTIRLLANPQSSRSC